MKTLRIAALMMTAAMASSTFAQDIDKQPDIGPYWHPVGNGGSYMYASDFICPDGMTDVSQLGMWLEPEGAPNSVVAMQVWGGSEATGPDVNDVIASTDDFTGPDAGLNLYVMDVTSQSAPLVPGERYWFVATGVDRGDPGNAGYRVGGHTQNSVYQDNGTFWYSNDAGGQSFDGQRLTPQMAHQVYMGAGGPSLSISGDCPGRITVCVENNNPRDLCAIIYGFNLGTGPAVPGCSGLTVDISDAVLLSYGRADSNGDFCASGNVPARACGRVYVQGVNVTQCVLTEVDGI